MRIADCEFHEMKTFGSTLMNTLSEMVRNPKFAIRISQFAILL